jgi:hypothetical protein
MAFAPPANASDLTLFGGIHRAGRLTFSSAPASASSFIKTFDPRTFGVFGARYSHGRVIGGEHTVAFAPNFIESDTRAFIYHSNLLIQAPLPILKPYGTAGAGLVHAGGSSAAAFGTKFAFNYGGGVKVTTDPIGLSLDVRGYTAPRISVPGFSVQQRLDFVQVTVGAVISFK